MSDIWGGGTRKRFTEVRNKVKQKTRPIPISVMSRSLSCKTFIFDNKIYFWILGVIPGGATLHFTVELKELTKGKLQSLHPGLRMDL